MSLDEIIDCIDYDGNKVRHIEFMTDITCDPLFMSEEKTLGLTYAERLHYEEVYLDEFQCRFCKIKCMGEHERDEHEEESHVLSTSTPILQQIMRDNLEQR